MILYYSDATEALFTGNVKYVSGYGSSARVKCHRSSASGLKPCENITYLSSMRLAYCSSVISV